ncbi:MAG: hypothetical protein WC829_17870 [Hyphomicrobium sp.]|jgi:hypothetical protein
MTGGVVATAMVFHMSVAAVVMSSAAEAEVNARRPVCVSAVAATLAVVTVTVAIGAIIYCP